MEWHELEEAVPLGQPTRRQHTTSVSELYLSGNALGGEIPATIVGLVALSSAGLGYNKLTGSDPAVVTFLDDKDPDWAETQTVPPTDVQGASQSSYSAQLSWTPIAYTEDRGYYEVSYGTAPGGPYNTTFGTTMDKYTSTCCLK